jgi:hypothetical protein
MKLSHIARRTSQITLFVIHCSLFIMSAACHKDSEVEYVALTYSIGGTVTKSDGGAAAGATVQLQNATTGSNFGQTAVDATGTYLFAGVQAGKYQIIIMLDGYETATSNIEISSASIDGKGLVLQKIVSPTYSVGGAVTKSDGGAAAGATVRIFKAAGNTLSGQPATTNSEGAYTIASIPSGEYKIVATLDGYEAAILEGITVGNADVSGKDIVLQRQSANPNAVSIVFSDNDATINYPDDGSITVVKSGAHVTISTSSTETVAYAVSGFTSNGSLKIQNNATVSNTLRLMLNNATIASSSKLPPIQITKNEGTVVVELKGANALSDHSSNEENATLINKSGALEFEGYGSLHISGAAKHAIASSKKSITVRSGDITVTSAASDGFHAEAGFDMSGGSLNITASGDAIDAGSGTAAINGGNIHIVSAVDDTKGIKSDDNLTVHAGEISLTVSGKASKGLSSKKDIAINGGNIAVETSGATVLEASGSGYDPSYCTAVKADGNISVSGGTITITSLKTANGGKGLSADGDITVTGGNINVTTAGDGATYTSETGAKDSYSSACIKSDKNISLLGGKITCSSSGSGGKGISADGTLTVGVVGAGNEALVITASTTGQKFLVSGSTGGNGGPGGMNNADYANPKIIKSEGNLTVNSGTLRLTGTTDGGEGLESKATLTVNGGYMEIFTYDDCLNAATHIQINGGTIYARASGNDAIDSNGDIAITGGMLIVQGAEDGIDSDNIAIQITGGTVIGVSGQSMGSRFAGTQKYLSVSATAGSGIGVKIGDEWALLFVVPAGSTSGGGMGGNRGLTVIVSLPQFVSGATCTLYTGGSISGGTTTAFGYNIGGTYSGGSSKSYTIN